MSQKSQSSDKKQRSGSQTSSQGISLEQIDKNMKEHFLLINNSLATLVRTNTEIFRSLMQLIQGRSPPEEEMGREVVEELLKSDMFDVDQNQHPVDLSPSSRASTSADVSHTEVQSSVSKTITCADCGKVFIRGSLLDSITKHVSTTSCRPFGCKHCARLFRKSSLRNNHEKTHTNNNLKRKADDEPLKENKQPETKRVKTSDELPLKNLASQGNQMNEKGTSLDLFTTNDMI